jgi:PAS domain S-box-containing protein
MDIDIMHEPTKADLLEEVKQLKAKVAELEREKSVGWGSDQIYRALFEHAGFSIALLDPENHKRMTYNRAEYESLGYTREEFEALANSDLIVQVNGGDEEERIRTLVNRKGSHTFETWHRAKDGEPRCKLVSSVQVCIDGAFYFLNISSDITRLKKVEKALEAARNDLEEQVKIRTSELNRKTMELTESNTALKVLLRQRDDAMRDIEERALENIKQRVLPYIKKLKKMGLNETQLMNLIELDLNLKDIFSPFLRSLSKQYSGLTPMEVRIAVLIREGKSSKELTEILGVSLKTIESHRDNLREKLGLKHKKINLQSYLRTLNEP